ncbi:helix-turn-helix domain-containing protein [Staphylococcus xylosus]
MNKERNMIIAKNIKKFLKENNMSQKQLADSIGIRPSTMSDYLNLRSNPSHGVIQKIADAFGVVKSDIDSTYKVSNDITVIYDQLIKVRQNKVLKFATNQLQQQKESNVSSLDEYRERKKVPYPAYRATGAGIGEELYDDILSEEVYFYEDEIPDTADFCIFVNGDSMEPALRQGTYCFIQNIQQLKDGLVALVIYDGTVLIKKIALDENEIRLISLNPKYEDIIVKDHQQFKLVGKVVQ